MCETKTNNATTEILITLCPTKIRFKTIRSPPVTPRAFCTKRTDMLSVNCAIYNVQAINTIVCIATERIR